MTDRRHVVPPGEGEKATGEHTEGRFTLIEGGFGANAPGPPAHRHHDCDEAFYVLEGELTVRIDDELTTASVGTFVLVPRGADHKIANPSDSPCRFLMLFSPSGMEHFFRDQEAIEWGSLDDVDMARTLDDLAIRHHMEWTN